MPGNGPIRYMQVVGDIISGIGPFPGISPHYNIVIVVLWNWRVVGGSAANRHMWGLGCLTREESGYIVVLTALLGFPPCANGGQREERYHGCARA